MKKNNVSFFKYLKDNFYLDGFLEHLDIKVVNNINNDLDYCILESCSFGKKNIDDLLKELYDVKSDNYQTWDELRTNGKLITKLSNNFQLLHESVKRKKDAFLYLHILKSKINSKYYITSYFIDLDDSNWTPEYLILHSFKTLKDAKKSSSIILKKFKTKGIYPSTLG